MKMRISELARQSNLSLATVKFYLREGLLHSGERTSVNQAFYDESHLQRLKLIHTLTKVADLPLEKVHHVIAALDSPLPTREALGLTHAALSKNEQIEPDVYGDSALKLSQVIELQGWKCQVTSPAFTTAVEALDALAGENVQISTARLNRYATAADAVGRIDLEGITSGNVGETRSIVLGSILRKPLLDALILLAQEHHVQKA